MIPLPTADEDLLVALRDLDFSYDGKTDALRGVCMDIWRGERIALVGGNGSGKTTLAKHLNGLLKPTGGKATVMGRDTSAETVAALSRMVGYAFQNPDHQLFCSTVGEEILFGPRNIGVDELTARERCERAMDLLSVRHLKDKAPLSLSLGNRRRVSIASVIAMDPEILVLDEPSAGLDATESAELMDVIDGLNRDGKTIILITHEMRLVAEHSDRVVVMANGNVVLDCRTSAVFTDFDTLLAAGLTPPPIAQLAHMLRDHGISSEVLDVKGLVGEISRAWRGTR